LIDSPAQRTADQTDGRSVRSVNFIFYILYFRVPEPRMELGAALQQHDALPLCYVATLRDLLINCLIHLSRQQLIRHFAVGFMLTIESVSMKRTADQTLYWESETC